KRWFSEVCAEYELEAHHIKLLTLACEAWDRGQQARQELDRHGLTYTDSRGQPRIRPEIAFERDSRISFARLMRELDLDCADPDGAPRPPPLRSNRRVKPIAG